MKESYYSLGIEMSWVNAAFFIFLFVGIAVGRSIKARTFVWNLGDVAVVAWNMSVWLFRIPISIGIPLTVLVMGVPQIWSYRKHPKYTQKRFLWNMSSVIVAPLLYMAALLFLFRHTITLSGTKLADEGGSLPSSAPRTGLRVDATGSPQWIKNRKSWSWTTWAGNSIAPGWMGQEVFVGPHGFISGDDLGKRVAEWAGTKVNYRWLGKD